MLTRRPSFNGSRARRALRALLVSGRSDLDRLARCSEQADGIEREFAAAGEPLAQPGRLGWQRQRRQLAVVDVGLDGEEQVVAAGVVPVLGGRAHDPDPAGHQLVCLSRAGERGVVVGAHEHDRGPGALGSVAGVGEAPAAQERVVGEELLAVVGGAGGEVDLDEQVEGELQRFDAELEREVGLDLGERLELEVDDRLPVGDRDLVERDRVAALAGADLGDRVAAGGVAGGAPAVGRDVADGAVELDRPAERVQVVREPAGARLLDRPPFALGGDRRRGLALLRDLEAAAGQRVEQRRFAVVA